MSDTAAFLDLVARGEASLDEIDDFIDRWHGSDTQQSLASYLGMTDDEYAAWLAEPDQLAAIQARRLQRAAV
jgi:hypothetical protein